MSHENRTRGSQRRTSKFPKPAVEPGHEYTVDVTDNGRAGDGIARICRFSNFCKKYKSGKQERRD